MESGILGLGSWYRYRVGHGFYFYDGVVNFCDCRFGKVEFQLVGHATL